MTYYQVFNGPGTAFDRPRGAEAADFPDGEDRTLLVVEAGEPVPWTRPLDLPYGPDAQLPPLGGVFKPGTRPFVSGGVGGFTTLLADGSVHFFYNTQITEPRLRALITRDGGEKVSVFGY